MPHETQTIDRERDRTQEQTQQLSRFDYGAAAELFPGSVKKGRGRITYKRFDTAAEALRFAVEKIPAAALLGAYLEVNDGRFGIRDIRQLYESAAYPLERWATAN